MDDLICLQSAEQKKKAEALKGNGNKALTEKKYTDAIRLYTEAIALDPTNVVYFSNRAAAYSQNNEHNKAIDDAKAAIALDSNYSKSYSRLGHAYYSLGNYSESVDAYETGLKLDPSNASLKQALQVATSKLPAASSRGDELSTPTSAGSDPISGLGGGDFASMMNNPNLMSMGRFEMRLLDSGRLRVYAGNTNVQIQNIDGPIYETWNHIAVVHSAPDWTGDPSTPSLQNINVFLNGVLVVSTQSETGFLRDAYGLYLCQQPFWGQNFGNFKGFIDEFRIWNVSRSISDIRSTINKELTGSEKNLITYYNFNQNSTVVDSYGTYWKDLAGSANLYGGLCVTPGFPHCNFNYTDESGNILQGPPCFTGDNAFGRQCVASTFRTTRNGSIPTTLPSGAILTSQQIQEITIYSNKDPAIIRLLGRSPNFDKVSLRFSSVPVLGILSQPTSLFVKESSTDLELLSAAIQGKITVKQGDRLNNSNIVLYYPSLNGGGKNYANFSYYTTDESGMASDSAHGVIHVLCPGGSYADRNTMTCVLCAAGTFQPTDSMVESCQPCSVGTYQNNTGSLQCISTPKGYFTSTQAASAYLSCQDYNYPQPYCETDLTYSINNIFSIVVLIIVLLVEILIIVSMIFIWIHKSNPNIRSFGTNLLLLLSVALMIGVALPALWSVFPTRSVCIAQIWLGHLSISLVLA
ncbi:hypothetical protein HK096_002744 [Nowakowskiella sp. JEL0078]|nr:hypothetical protein HK096_002744 [Nowakowskiella sp. JEL0078]